MSKRLEKNKHLLRFLLEDDACILKKKQIFRTLTDNQLMVICEIIQNILQGVIDLPSNKLAFIRKHKQILRKIVSKTNSKREKKKNISRKFRIIISILRLIKRKLFTFLK